MPQDRELEIRRQFLEEAQEYLNTIESAILESITLCSAERMDAVLRAAHSIKGGAAMMGFQILSQIAHRLEDCFKVLKTQQPAIDAELESQLLAGVDLLRSCIALDQQGKVDDEWVTQQVNPVFERLHQRLGAPTLEDTVALLSPEDGQDMVAMLFETEVEEYLERLESALANPEKPCLLEEISIMAVELGELGEMLQLTAFKSLCESITQHLEATPERVEEIAFLALQEWRRSQAALMVGQVDTLPTQIDIEMGEQALGFALPAGLVEPQSQRQFAHSADDHSPPPPQPSTLVPTAELKESQDTVRVPLKQLEQINDLFGELTIERNGLNLYLERLRNLAKILIQRVRNLQKFDTRQQVAYGRKNNYLNPPVDSDLDQFPLEAMETIVRVQEVTDDINLTLEDTNQTVGDLNRTAKQLQTTINQVRMRPLSDLVDRFPRFLRELSSQYSKNVELKTHGTETLIDRTILETLGDPLMHLLRNAFDHGIEDHETRQAVGKPEQGVIEIRAVYQGNQMLISISDDGGGIDPNKIRRQAMHLGLDATAIAAASDEELLTLIFEPGFSTAAQVTTLSGRGVGMDVVRTNLRQIRGDIKVDTQLGLGTTFTLSVPLTLSVARVLLVESNGMLLAFPTDAIKEMLLLKPEDIFTINGKEVLNWQGHTTPLIRLKQWLEFRCPHKTVDSEMPTMSYPTVLMVAQGNEWVGIQVERCWGEQEVAIRQVEGVISMPPGFIGCTILGDGRVVPLVNPPELLHWIASCKQSYNFQKEPKHPTTTAQSQKDAILVVDDSVNIRRFLGLSLEKAGYRVEQAKDGQDALEKLLSGLQVKAVICDIDMPRLDGYGLLARVKSNPAFQNLPITMLTSRAAPKERQLAMNLGAAAYFCKPYNEQDLLQTIEELIRN